MRDIKGDFGGEAAAVGFDPCFYLFVGAMVAKVASDGDREGFKGVLHCGEEGVGSKGRERRGDCDWSLKVKDRGKKKSLPIEREC